MQILQHRRQKAEKPGEASEHTDAQLNKHLAANTEILPQGTLRLRSGGRAAAECKNMCSHDGMRGGGRGEKRGGGLHALRGLTCFNWTVRVSSSSLTHTMAGWRTLLGSRMSTWPEDKHCQFTSGYEEWGVWGRGSCFQHYLLTHIQQCVLTTDPSIGPHITLALRSLCFTSW